MIADASSNAIKASLEGRAFTQEFSRARFEAKTNNNFVY